MNWKELPDTSSYHHSSDCEIDEATALIDLTSAADAQKRWHCASVCATKTACLECLAPYNMFERSMVAGRIAGLIGCVDQIGFEVFKVGPA